MGRKEEQHTGTERIGAYKACFPPFREVVVRKLHNQRSKHSRVGAMYYGMENTLEQVVVLPLP